MKAIKIFSSVGKISWVIFKFFGFIPASSHDFRKMEKLDIFSVTWSGIVMISVTIYAGVIMKYQEGIFNVTALGKINDTLKFLSGSAAHFVSLCESVMNMKKFRLIFKRLTMFDDECKNLNVNFIIYKREFLKSFAIRFFCTFVIGTLMDLYVLFSIDSGSNFVAANLFPTIACRLKHLQYMFYLHLILSKIKIIQIELTKSFEDSSHRFHSATYERDCEKLIDRLQVLKNVYGILWRTTHDINEMFVWSITANLIHNFVQLGCDSYWAVINYWEAYDEQECLKLIYIITATVVLIVSMLRDANLVKIESAKIPVILHRLRKSRDEFTVYKMESICTISRFLDIKNILIHFSIQLRYK